ncbi:Crp/Fnr family transcriptional regulator [uncultured Muribaculum sp.]|uniref:Crp/Fnr family transcriptional regulator n=1 Tax=uncultured Muribaculum sp. TaxID=1918613 RepID=UPI0025D573D6|nr:Crp/Fnr family transcriptional regulator [uncultured Muribaculum sp.]
MTDNFNSYIDSPAVAYWRDLCLKEGIPRHYDKGEDFFTAGYVAQYLGFIRSGTLKYVAYGHDGSEHVLGLEFTGEFVADFPFSFRNIPARTSVVATTPCDILCIPTATIGDRIDKDSELKDIVMISTEAVFSTVYDRYAALYAKSPQERYNDLITKHPDLFNLFSLKDIASFLKITPTHLSRLRKNINL